MVSQSQASVPDRGSSIIFQLCILLDYDVTFQASCYGAVWQKNYPLIALTAHALLCLQKVPAIFHCKMLDFNL
jgi:hypothetical protein